MEPEKGKAIRAEIEEPHYFFSERLRVRLITTASGVNKRWDLEYRAPLRPFGTAVEWNRFTVVLCIHLVL